MNKTQSSLVVGITLSALSVLAVSLAYQQRPFATSVAFRALAIFLGMLSAISVLRALSKFAPGSRWMKLSLVFTFATAVFLVVVLIIAILGVRLGG